MNNTTMTEQPKNKPLVWIGQGVLYAFFAVLIAVFSGWPPYRHIDAGDALVKVSFSHHGQRLQECHVRSPEELAKLPPNMRSAQSCPRERTPVSVEIDIDGKPAWQHVAAPAGLRSDGASAVYHRVVLPAGEHHISVRVKDSAGDGPFDYQREGKVTLVPLQVLVIDFDGERKEIVWQ